MNEQDSNANCGGTQGYDAFAAFRKAGSLAGKTVVLCVSGSIAAFKAVEIARLLLMAGAKVLPVLTRSGSRFVGHATFTGICGTVARDDMWDPNFSGELHIHLASQAALVLVAPATADIIARMAQGRADDLSTTVALCARCPVLVAPAMHPRMWEHPSTQRNVRMLLDDGRAKIVGPVAGMVANGEVGVGRMAEPGDIFQQVVAMLSKPDLAGKRIVVTAGPTVEDIDPVRFIGNRSSGRMGFAIAQRAGARGAIVTLIAGPVDLPTPSGVTRVDVRSALEMQSQLEKTLGLQLQEADALVMTAAVSDYRPATSSPGKLKRTNSPTTVGLVPNPDILRGVGEGRGNRRVPLLVGFAVETDSGQALIDKAREKLVSKSADVIVANSAGESFGLCTNHAVIVTRDASEQLETMPKEQLADLILDRVRDELASRHA